MMKKIESGFLMKNIRGNGYGRNLYIMHDLPKAIDAIKAVLTEEQLKAFSINTLQIIENLEFKPLNFAKIREYVEIEFLLTIQDCAQDTFDMKKMRRVVKNCERYAQRYELQIDDPKVKLTIGATATSQDLDLLKQKFKALLVFFDDPTIKQDVGDINLYIFSKIRKISIDFNINKKNFVWISFAFG